MSLSACPFCQGERAEIGRSRMPMARTRRMKSLTVDTVPIAHHIARCISPAEGLGQLPRNPFGGRMGGHPQPEELPARMLQDQKSIQQPKRDRRHHKQIHRRDAVGMIVKEGLPALRRWAPPLRHVLCHRGLPDIDAELEQFAVNARCAPERIGDAHLANELANFGWGPRSTAPGSRFPAPIGPKAGTMPADHGIGFDDLQRVENAGSQRDKARQTPVCRCPRRRCVPGTCGAARSIGAEAPGSRLPAMPATGTAQQRHTRSACRDRPSPASINQFAPAD